LTNSCAIALFSSGTPWHKCSLYAISMYSGQKNIFVLKNKKIA
jgi:hypothetical protein